MRPRHWMHRVGSLSALVAALVVFVGCGGGMRRLEPRYVAVHNALVATGLAQSGPITEGTLPEGATSTVAVHLPDGTCHTFVALGDRGIADLEIVVVDSLGAETAHETAQEPEAAVRICSSGAGEYQVRIRAVRGSGGYTLSSWSGGPAGGAQAAPRLAADEGTCDGPLPLEVGSPVHGSTLRSSGRIGGSCGGDGAPENVYRLVVDERAQISAIVQSEYDAVVYLQRSCGDAQDELACNDDAEGGDISRSEIHAVLEPGAYFLVVDGYGNAAGEYELIVSTTGLASTAAVCDDAPVLVSGQQTTGSTAGLPGYFTATCASGAGAPDRVYRLDVPDRSRVRVRQRSDHDGVLYVRRTCDDENSEVACNDDFGDARHSLLTFVADPGQYFVYTDGYGTSSSGNYEFNADVTPEAGAGADADACDAPGTLTVGQGVAVDTFQAQDDLAGTCGGGGAPDVVYRVHVDSRSRVTVAFSESEFDGVAYLRRACAVATSEVSCTRDVNPGSGTALDTTVDAGDYYLVIDGTGPSSFGSIHVEVAAEDTAATERMCRTAPLIQPGRAATGDTTGLTNRFEASCAGGARSNDQVYRLQLRRRSHVVLDLRGSHDGALYIRSNCADASTEVSCNDDSDNGRDPHIDMTLDAGMYYVIVDGYGDSENGTYSLTTQVDRVR